LKADKAMVVVSRVPVEFLALISHELRNPIKAILGWADIVDNRSVDLETSSHAIQVIKRNTRRQGKMISQQIKSAATQSLKRA